MVSEGFPLLWASVRCVGRNGLVRCVDVFWQTLQMKHPHLLIRGPPVTGRFGWAVCVLMYAPIRCAVWLRVNPSKSASSR